MSGRGSRASSLSDLLSFRTPLETTATRAEGLHKFKVHTLESLKVSSIITGVDQCCNSTTFVSLLGSMTARFIHLANFNAMNRLAGSAREV